MTSLIAAQPGIWIADKLSEFENAYVVVHYIDLRGILDVCALVNAIMDGMKEADTLQMSYNEIDGEPQQQFQGVSLLPQPEIIDFRNDLNPLESANLFMQEDMNRNLRVGNSTLIRHAILQVDHNHWLWYQRYHHIQVDAYSFTALTRRMADLYSYRVLCGSHKLSTNAFESSRLAIDEYSDYQKSSKFSKDVTFWKEYCARLPPPHTLSAKPLSGVQPSKNIVRRMKMLDPTWFTKYCDLGSQEANVNDADLALALIAVWLMKLCNCDSMSVGFIFMRRLGSVALNTSGPFINVLPISLAMDDEDTFNSLAIKISRTLKLIRRHQKLDSEQIVRNSNRSWENSPLFGPVINFKAFDYRLNFAGLEYTTHHVASGPIRDIEIVLYIDEKRNMYVECLANSNRYDLETIDQYLLRLDLLLEKAAVHPTLKCLETSLILPQEEQLISKVNSNYKELTADETLVSLLQKQAYETPNACALQDSNHRLTYSDVQGQVYALVKELSVRGIKQGCIVAVEMERSVFMSIAMQAILTMGSAYLPLDPSYPVDRLRMMVDDAKPKLVLCSGQSCVEDMIPTIVYDCLLPPLPPSTDFKPSENQTAYIIYTSGSTGKPKGVMVDHKAIVNRLLWMQGEYELKSDDVVLQKTPSSFDVSVWELFWPLITGATLHMAPPNAHRDPEQLIELILAYKVTTMHFVPSMLSTFLGGVDASKVSGTLRRVFCSGEALPTQLSISWQNVTNVPLYNLYGPTEAAIDVTAYPAFGKYLDETLLTVPIGFPVWNTSIYVLNAKMLPQPVGISGDLYIAGNQLAQGYLNRPELTDERFISRNGIRMYKTGDIAYWNSNGALVFMGRSDDQVKLRGQRIELGEIDSAMESVPGVHRAVTQPQNIVSQLEDEGDSRQLIGYLVEDEENSVNLAEVKQYLCSKLPAYMVPVKLVILDKLPLNSSGKLDRKALPIPSYESNVSRQRRKPYPGLEQEIAEEFCNILGCSEVCADDDFFSLGGHSLLAVRLVAVLRKRLGLPISIGQIMQTPKIEMLAKQLGDDSNREAWKTAGFETILPLRSSHGPAVFCIHPASGFSWQFSVLRRYLDPKWSLIGIQSADSNGPMGNAKHLNDVIDSHYDTITQYSDGPYYLLGYSLGGTIAHSLAAKLQKAGKVVAFLGLLDTWPPETQNWDEKKQMNVVDTAVVEEMQRERELFLEASKVDSSTRDGGFSNQLFDIIESNYSNAVRLLATARSSRYEGTTTLFFAKRTFPNGTDLDTVWKRWTKTLNTIEIDCSHVDIIHAGTFATLGPKINELLK